MKNSIEKKAYGKLNLSLDVLGKREDGYHLVRMIMQTVNIFDTVTIERIPEEEIRIRTDSGDIPAGPDNLCWAAASEMKKTFGLAGGLVISIRKRIPIAAGMAGGSTDAAAVFTGIRELFDLKVTDQELQKLALPYGADIPYCITGGTQLSEGIGEILTPLEGLPQTSLIVVKPDLFVSTGWVYKAFDSIPEEEVIHPDVDAMIASIRSGDLKGVADTLGNVLEQKTGAEYPVIGELERFLEDQGAIRSIMTGSGPTVFAFFADDDQADRALRALEQVPEWNAFQKFRTGFVFDIHE